MSRIESNESVTAMPGDKCHCGGEIFRKAVAYQTGQFFYAIPRCEICGQVYMMANPDKVKKKGEEEFLRAYLNM